MDPSSPIEGSYEKETQRLSHPPLTRQYTGASHVPYDHFARNESRQELDMGIAESNNQPSGSTSVVETLVEEKSDFRFDKFLQDKWNECIEAGIDTRQTGVTFKVCMRPPIFSAMY